MTDPTEKMEPAADASWLEMETIRGKPIARHRADPMGPANPHTADPELESFYEQRIAEGRTEPSNLWGIVLFVASCVSVVWLVVWAVCLS